MIRPDGVIQTHIEALEQHWGCALRAKGNTFELPQMDRALSPSEWESLDIFRLRESCKTYVERLRDADMSDMQDPLDFALIENVVKLAPFLLDTQVDSVARMVLKEMTVVAKDFFIPVHGHWLAFASLNVFKFSNPPCRVAGGILWGDTGVGKTAQTCALIACTNKMKTLVVCPPKIVKQWEGEIKRFIPDKRLFVLYGNVNGDCMGGADVVLTSYNTLVHRHAMCASIEWDRLVMDEGAEIGKTTACYRSLVSIRAARRWILTATPLGKRGTMDHLHVVCSLIGLKDTVQPDFRFLYDSMLMEPLIAGRDGNLHMVPTTNEDLLQRINDRVPKWAKRKSIAVVGDFPGAPTTIRTALAYTSGRSFMNNRRVHHDPCVRLASGLFTNMCIRQVQSNVSYRVVQTRHPVELPYDYLNMIQRVRYWWGHAKNLVALGIMRSALNFEVSEETLMNLLTPLRPSSQRVLRDGTRVNVGVFEGTKEEVCQKMRASTFVRSQLECADNFTCPICLEEVPVSSEAGTRNPNLVFSQCGHPFCREHGVGYFMSARACWCRKSFDPALPVLFSVTDGSVESGPPQHIVSPVQNPGQRTAKIEKSKEVIEGHLAAGRQVVVFCANDKSCNDLRYIMQRGRVLAGSTPIRVKQKLFTEFQSGSVDVLFTTPKSSSTGINLQSASAIVFADPCVFEAERKQCVGRVARYGQTSPCVYIDTIYASNTCEEMFPLQNNNYLWSHIDFSHQRREAGTV